MAEARGVRARGYGSLNPQVDLDFESTALKGFGGGDSARSGRYKVDIDKTVAYTGQQSLKMQFAEPKGPAFSSQHSPPNNPISC